MPKFTRVALEGATIDGRAITRQQIIEMSEQYDPDKRHGARIWLEHFRSLFADGVFPALGDVIQLKTEEVDVDSVQKLGLYAELRPTDQLLEMNQKKQKVFTSIEMTTNYADTGRAYLTGLAVTDSPASQGTQMLAFSQQNNFQELQGKLFSEYLETELQLTDEQKADQDDSFFDRVKKLFTKQGEHVGKHFAGYEQSIEFLAKELQKQQQKIADKTNEIDQLKQSFNALEEKLNTAHFNKQRPPATGGNNYNKTDC